MDMVIARLSMLERTSSVFADAAASQALLRRSAALARILASWLCSSDDGHGCCHYHAVWQYLRLLGLTRTLERQRDFYHLALAGLAEHGKHPRLLVSGTADHALPGYCAAAYAASPATLDLTVMDRCYTPLAVCQWHAALAGYPITTHAADILGWQHPAASFDVICSHSFLGRFQTEQQPDLLAVWHRLLRRGGQLLTATRLQVGHRLNDDGPYSPHQVEVLRARVVALAQACRDPLDVAPEHLGQMAASYARTMTDYPPKDADTLVGLLQKGGFRVDVLALDDSVANARTPASSREPHSWQYATVQATRL